MSARAGGRKVCLNPVVWESVRLAWTSLTAAVIHLGRALCGHDGIIHGGLIATVFDESLARNVSASSAR